jgi:hypothetical protein
MDSNKMATQLLDLVIKILTYEVQLPSMGDFKIPLWLLGSIVAIVLVGISAFFRRRKNHPKR